MFNILPYIPLINYKEHWINEKLDVIKLKRNYEMFRDNDGKDIDWNIVEYILSIYYNEKYFGSLEKFTELRLYPNQLINYIQN